MQAWELFLQKQEIELGANTVQKWLRGLKVLRFDACNLYLEAKDSFQLLWFEEHLRTKVKAEFVNENHKKIEVHLAIKGDAPAQKKSSKKRFPVDRDQSQPFELLFDELDPYALFDHFIKSDENLLVSKIIDEMLKAPTLRASDNPIYIYGPTGSGKTHLLMSIAHHYRKLGLRTIYTRAETFTNHVVTAIRAGQMNIFRQAYRHADVLLVDDVHVFSRRGATQEEFFHTFNTLHLDGKQIILTSNCCPQELQLIEPRLVSRFEWGIALPLKPLQESSLGSLLNSKVKIFNFPLQPKILDYLLSNFSRNSKTLVRSFEALMLRLHLENDSCLDKLSLNAVKVLLNDLSLEEQKAALTPDKIITAAARHYDLKTEDILGKAQTKECALPRQVAMYLCRDRLKLPYMRIGEIFSRDHSTVMASVKYIQKLIEEGVSDALHSCYTIIKLADE